MICSYCGASYRKNAEKCPNCRSENPLMIEKRKDRVRQDIDRQAMEAVKDLPKKKVIKAHTIVIIVIVGLLIILVFGCIFGYTWSKYKAKIEYSVYQRNVEKMEKLLAGEQWEELDDYYFEHECWDSKYDKYEQIIDAKRAGVDNVMTACENYHNWLENYKKFGNRDYADRAKESLEDAFGYYADMCDRNQKYVNDRVILGNEKLLKQWEEETTDYIRTALQMTDEELEIILGDRASEEYRELIRKYIERDTK